MDLYSSGKDQSLTFANSVTSVRCSYRGGKILLMSYSTISFSIRTLLHGVRPAVST
jgi:hypothetical protein